MVYLNPDGALRWDSAHPSAPPPEQTVAVVGYEILHCHVCDGTHATAGGTALQKKYLSRTKTGIDFMDIEAMNHHG